MAPVAAAVYAWQFRELVLSAQRHAAAAVRLAWSRAIHSSGGDRFRVMSGPRLLCLKALAVAGREGEFVSSEASINGRTVKKCAAAQKRGLLRRNHWEVSAGVGYFGSGFI